MHARLARLATAIQLLCGGVSSRYGDSSYVGSKVSLQTDSKEVLKAFLTADRSKINPKHNLVTSSGNSLPVAVQRWSQRLTTWLANPRKEDDQNHC